MTELVWASQAAPEKILFEIIRHQTDRYGGSKRAKSAAGCGW